MTYLIIFIVIALVISPVFWMMPSPRQKRQMQLRQRAMALGLQIKVCDLPQSHRSSVRKENPEQGVVYRLLWRRPDVDNETFHFLSMRGEGNPAPRSSIDALLAQTLSNMDATIVAVEYASSGLAVYWRENAALEMVDQIFQQLQGLKQALSEDNVPG